MDMEVLIRVIISHMVGHVEIHPADGVHHLAHQLPVDHHIVVGHKPHQLRHLRFQRLDTVLSPAVVVVDAVDALVGAAHIDGRIPGDGHDGGLLVGHVIGHHHNRVRQAGGLICAEHQDGEVIRTLALSAGQRGHSVDVWERVAFSRGQAHRDAG